MYFFCFVFHSIYLQVLSLRKVKTDSNDSFLFVVSVGDENNIKGNHFNEIIVFLPNVLSLENVLFKLIW